MNYQQTFKIGLKQGCLFYALSTLLLAIQFGSYIIGSTVLDFMDFRRMGVLHCLQREPCLTVCIDTLSIGHHRVGVSLP